jgi:hypothetical protein
LLLLGCVQYASLADRTRTAHRVHQWRQGDGHVRRLVTWHMAALLAVACRRLVVRLCSTMYTNCHAPFCLRCLRVLTTPQELYKQIAWPCYKAYGHAFDAFKNMVQDEGAALFKKLEDDRGAPLTVLTPEVRQGLPSAVLCTAGLCHPCSCSACVAQHKGALDCMCWRLKRPGGASNSADARSGPGSRDNLIPVIVRVYLPASKKSQCSGALQRLSDCADCAQLLCALCAQAV